MILWRVFSLLNCIHTKQKFHTSRSIIFTNGTEESRLATVSKEREQTKSKSGIVTTQIQQLETFYMAEPDHQVCILFSRL